MTRRKSGYRVPVLLLLVCTVLVWLVYRQLAAPPSPEAATDPSALAEAAVPELPPKPQFSMRPIEDFRAVLERPIFSPTRRPPPVEEGGSVVESGGATFTLKGILIDDQERVALFRPGRGAKIVRLGEGDRLEGWTLVRIEADRVTLERGGVEKVLEPAYDPASPAKPRKQRKKREQGASQ